MEEFERLRKLVRSERYRIFKWMSESLELDTRFMIPDEEAREGLGHDGSTDIGLESLHRVINRDRTAASK